MTFRFACRQGRAQLVVADHGDGPGLLIDLAEASHGRFSADPMEAFARWDEVRAFAAGIGSEVTGSSVDRAALDAPSPRPRQVFGIGLNYRSHAEESGMPLPAAPLTFTKFSSSVASGDVDIQIAGPAIDWEVELVVVTSTGGRDLSLGTAWDHVAGVCIGQDISDRALQFASQPPQFSLGKSRQNYSPFGPWLVDARDLSERDALNISCTLNGTEVQRTSTDDLIFSVPAIVAYLSSVVELLPGDVIFTGTPSGVGGGRKPPRFLTPGDVLVSTLDGVGSITNRCV